MKKFLSVLMLSLVAESSLAGLYPTNGTPLRIMETMSSWNLGFSAFTGDYYGNGICAVYNVTSNGVPNSIFDWGQSGLGLSGAAQNNFQQYALPFIYVSQYPVYNKVVGDDNGNSTSNQYYAVYGNINLSASGQFYDGVSYTNSGLPLPPITNDFVGSFPHPSSNMRGTVNGLADDAATNYAQVVGTSSNSLINMCITNGFQADYDSGNLYLYFPLESGGPDQTHYSAAGGLINANQMWQKDGINRFVSTLMLDWNNTTAYTNGCCVVSMSKTGNTLTFTYTQNKFCPFFDCGWGAPTLQSPTNDARYALLIQTNLAFAFTNFFGITNGPGVGTYTWYFNGQYCDQGSDQDWAYNGFGRSWFTNCVPTNPNTQVRSNGLALARMKKGANPKTLEVLSLGNGHAVAIPGAVDNVVYQSHANNKYNTLGLRFLAYLTNTSSSYTMTNDIQLMTPFDNAIYTNYQVQTWTATVVFTPTRYFPGHR